MWPYGMLFAVFALVALRPLRPAGPSLQPGVSTEHWSIVLRQWGPVFLLLALMIGLRHEVGADWLNYLWAIDWVPESLAEVLVLPDPAYGLLNWTAAEMGLSVYFVNSVCAGLFSWGLVAFCRRQPLPWLALVVAVPYLITVVAMGYTRQGVAIGLAMLGLAALDQGRVMRFVFWLSVAATFHKSAVILVPLALLARAGNRFLNLVVVGLVTAGLFVWLLQESVEHLRLNYLEAAYASSGAAIRVAMNALPAVLFLILRKRFGLNPAQRMFWTWIALLGIGFVGLLYVSPSSTAVDRLALYWIPLQLFVLSHLPTAMGRPDQPNRLVVHAVVAYSALVLFVWLVFADHAQWWIPYQFYPWVSLGQ